MEGSAYGSFGRASTPLAVASLSKGESLYKTGTLWNGIQTAHLSALAITLISFCKNRSFEYRSHLSPTIQTGFLTETLRTPYINFKQDDKGGQASKVHSPPFQNIKANLPRLTNIRVEVDYGRHCRITLTCHTKVYLLAIIIKKSCRCIITGSNRNRDV